MGDDGIVSNVAKAKILHEDESAKEDLQLAWSANMSKFYEDIALGKATMDDIENYFNESELNLMLGSGGTVHAVTFNKELKKFSISYSNEVGVPYVAEITSAGEVTKLERTDKCTTEVWVSLYDNKILTYTTSSDRKLEGVKITYQWNITEGTAESVDDLTGIVPNPEYEMIYVLSPSVLKVQVLDEIVPKKTDCLFANLMNCTVFEGLDKVNYSYCKTIGAGEFFNCKKINNIVVPEEVEKIDVHAFRDCSSLTNITLSSKTKSIGKSAFKNCTGLTTITIPASVKTIEPYTFDNCTSLSTINISRPTGSISGAPWSSVGGITVNWNY